MDNLIAEYQVWIAGFVLFLCMVAGLLLYTVLNDEEVKDGKAD